MRLVDKLRPIVYKNFYKIDNDINSYIKKVKKCLEKNAKQGIDSCSTKIPYEYLDIIKKVMKDEGYNVRTYNSNKQDVFIEVTPID